MAKTYNQIKKSVLGKDYDINKNVGKQPKKYSEIKADVMNGKYNFERIKSNLEKEIGLDTFETDLSSMGKTIGDISTSWQTQETMQNTRASVESMQNRLRAFKEYTHLFSGNNGSDVSKVIESYGNVLDGWKDLSKQYGRYKSADEYTAAIKSTKDKLAEEEKMKTDDLGVVKTEIADMEKIYNKASEMTKNLSNQSLNVRSVSDAQRFKNTYDKNTKDREAYVKSMGYESYDALEKALGNKKTYLNRAEWIQKGIELASVGGKDFEEKSKYVAPEEKSGFVFGNTYDDDVYKYINGEELGYINDSASAGILTVGYEYMTDQEKKAYNYYYRSGDKEKAKEYLNTITESLGSRKAMADFEGYEGKTFKELAYGVNAGLNQFMSGMKNLTNFSDEYIPVDATQQLSGMIRDDLNYEHGNWGTVPYDFITTTSNMLPSILASSVVGAVATPVAGQIVGSSLMGASASGNAYQEMLNLGYDKTQARVYSGLVGVSEAALQSAIGGIGKLGGVGGKSSSLIKSIDNAFGRFAVNYGKSIVAEGFEEAAQEVLNPIFQNIAAGYDTGAEVDWGEVVYSGLLGMMSGGFWEGGPSVSRAMSEVQAGKDIKANERVSDLFDIANNPEIAEAYETYTRYANKGINADNVSNAQLGRLYNEVKSDAVETYNSKKSTQEHKDKAEKTLTELSIVDTENTVKKEAKKLNVGDETKVTESGVAVDIKDLKVKGDDITVATEKGDISVDDMTLTQKDAELVVMAKGIAQTEGENVANLFLNQYDGKTNVEEYANSFNLTMAYAKNNFRYDTILNKKGELSAETVSAIYQEVRIKADQEQKAKFKKLAKQMADKKFYKGSIDESVIDYNNTSAEGKVNWNDLTQRQREAVTFVKGIAQATGMNLVFVANNPKFNGKYDRTKNILTINLDKGGFDTINNLKETIIPTMSHETTHWMKEKSPELWRHLNEIVFSTLAEHYNSNTEQAIKDKIAILDRLDPKIKHTEEDAKERTITEEDLIRAEMSRKGESDDVAREEIIARACEDMLKMSEQGRKIFNSLSETEQKSLFEKMKAIIKDLLNWVNDLLNSYESTSTEARIMREYKDQLEKASKVWDKMLEDSVKVNQALEKSGEFENSTDIANVGLQLDAETNSIAPDTLLSEKTWRESEYVQDRETAINAIVKALNVTEKEAERYVDNINGIARLIADDRTRLDYESNIDEHASALKTNKEYKWTVDMSTLCAKRLLFTGTFDAIQKKLPNTIFNSDDIVALRSMMMKRGYEVACGICYVESTRRELGPITAEFIERYKLAQKNGTPISKINSAGKEVILQEKGTKRNFYAEDGYVPTLAELNTTDIDFVKRDHPEVYAAYLSFMKSRGQAIPKLLETRTEYKGEILKHFNSNSAVKSRNDAGGLRVQSFSDFEVAHLIDMMQIVLDMSRVGLMSQAYTKVPAFADVFGNTGMKINLSLIAKGSGLDANGNLIFDDVEGMPHKEAFRLRDKYSKNVGTILVGKNDAHIRKALADPRIDFVIPFHKSFWKESLYESLGLTGYEDYTETQNEKPFDKERKIKNFQPSEYWDYSKSGKENAETYLKMCEEDGRIPKFPQFQNCEGYWKLLIDFKMYDNDGVGSPQMVVKPEFSMDDANAIMDSYEGGHREFPVAQDVVEDFVKQYEVGKDILYSDDFIDSTIKSFGIEKLGDYVHVQRQVLNTLVAENFFTDIENRKREDINEASGMVIETNKSGIDETFNLRNYARIGKNKKITKLATIRRLPEIIKNGTIIDDNVPNQYGDNKNKRFAYIEYTLDVDGKEVTIRLDIKKSPQKNKFWVHRVWEKENVSDFPASTNEGTEAGHTKADINKTISHPKQNVKELHSDKDSEGNTLTKEQQEYFKDSKVRDENGNLLVVYHGSPAKFTVFDHYHINKRGNSHGRGFYFTEKKSLAEGYEKEGGQLLKGYLNITKPLSEDKKTMKKADLLKLIKATCEAEARMIVEEGGYDNVREALRDTWISNCVNTYEMSIDSAYREVLNIYWNGNDNDVELIADLTNSGAGNENTLRVTHDILGYDGVIYTAPDGAHEFVSLVSEQFKSVDNTNPTTNPDIRYSEKEQTSIYDIMGETERILKENEKLREDVERLNERLKIERKVTHGNVLNNNQLLNVAGHLRKISNSTIDKVNLARSLKDVYSFIATAPNLTWEEVFEKSYRVAKDILAEAKPVTITDDYSKQILNEIRNTRIRLSEVQKNEAQHIFGKNWNRNFFGRVIITDSGTPIDMQWNEWAEMYPDLFDATISDTDMLGELYDIIGTLQDASETVMEYDAEEQARWLANEIYNQYWNVSPVRTTADKYEKRIKQLNYEHRQTMAEFREEYNARLNKRLKEQRKVDKEKYNNLINKIRERKNNEIAMAKQHGKDMMSKYKENAERKTVIQSILSTTTSLNKKLITNSKETHIPESLKPVVINLINAIDFSSKQLLGMDGSRRDARGTPTKTDVALENRFGKVKSMADDGVTLKQSIQDALKMFQNAEKVANNTADGTMDLSLVSLDVDLIESIESLITGIDVLEKNYGSALTLQQMEIDHLKTLNATVKSISVWASNVDRALSRKHKARISQLGEETIYENDALGERQEYIKTIESLKQFLSWSNLLPVNAFKRLGKSAMKVFDFVRDAQDDLTFHQDEITTFTEKLFKGHDVNKWREDIKEFKLNLPNGDTKTVRMPVSYIMTLYCVSKQEDAQRHLYGVDENGNQTDGGGMTIAPFQEKRSLKVSKDIDNTIMTEGLIKQITSALTKEQKNIADKLQEFMNTKGSEWCDEVSMALYGIKKFDVENYFPITVTPTTIKVLDPQDKRQSIHFFSILNYGFTKSRNPDAKQSIEIGDVFEIFANHMSMASIYSAYALPIYDMVRWYNYKGKDENGKEIGVIKSIQKAFGNSATTYIGRLISDLNGQHESSRLGFVTKIFKNTKLAMVGNSISVALLQPTAYLKAMTKIPTRYLLKSFLYVKDFGVKKGVEKSKKYCGIALWKSKGNFDNDISVDVKTQMMHDETWPEKLKEWSLWFAGKMDEKTWGMLWNACEFEVRDTRKDLKVGSEEFYETVAYKLRDVIYETQVVDSPLTRSDLMRSPDTGAKMITMFASEITVAYNIVHEALVDAKLDVKRYGKEGSLKRNGKKIAMALTAYTLTSAVSQIIYTAVQAFRDDDDEEKEFEDYLKMYLSNFVSDWLIVGKIPYIKEILNFAQGYSSSRPDTLWLDSTFKAVKYWGRAFDGKEGAGEKAIKESLKSVSYLSGIPMYNQYRELMASFDKLGILTAEDFEEMLDDLFN